MKGAWTGLYRYPAKGIPEEWRNRTIGFRITIREFDGVRFSGEVEEEVESGGIRGIGKLEGRKIKNRIQFVKGMPKLTYFLPDGSTLEEDRPHRTVYYSGIIEKGTVKGTWKIKFGIGKANGRMAVFLPIRGTWEMKRNE